MTLHLSDRRQHAGISKDTAIVAIEATFIRKVRFACYRRIGGRSLAILQSPLIYHAL